MLFQPKSKMAILTMAVIFSVFFTGCKKDGCTDPTAINYDPEATESVDASCDYPVISLDIESVVGSEPFAFNQVYQIGGVATTFTTAQFYLSEVGVESEGVSEVPGGHLLIKADQSLYEVGQITAGQKQMLSFAVGVDSANNFLDPTTAEEPLNLQAPSMHWNWNAGYIFIRIEGLVDTDSDGTPDSTLELHVGGLPQYTPVMVEVNHSADAVDSRIPIKVDFAKFLEGIDLANDNVTHTMDNMPLARAIVANVPGAFSAN